MKKLQLIITLILVACLTIACTADREKIPVSCLEEGSLRLAVEYNTHAACAFVAQENGLLSRQDSFAVYATGVALAGALTQGEIDAAYICLIPAIIAYANGGVGIKIVCGTHQYGYGLVVNRAKIKTVNDLEQEGIKIGCVNEGGVTDVLLYRVIDKYGLDEHKIMANVLRMNPAKQVMALETQKVDAVFVPEHFASLAAQDERHTMLLKAQDIWPEMQGSVLVVTDEFLKSNPQGAADLYNLTKLSSDYINKYPQEAAQKTAKSLNSFQNTSDLDLAEISQGNDSLEAGLSIIEDSMRNLEYTTSLEPKKVQEAIDYLYSLGYLKETFPAEDIILSDAVLEK